MNKTFYEVTYTHTATPGIERVRYFANEDAAISHLNDQTSIVDGKITELNMDMSGEVTPLIGLSAEEIRPQVSVIIPNLTDDLFEEFIDYTKRSYDCSSLYDDVDEYAWMFVLQVINKR